MSSSDFKIKFLKYNSGLEQKWREGILQEEWYKDYPQLFDEDDLGMARNQKINHFGEWYTAIHYFKKGWKVFIEHYVYSTNGFYTIREKKNEKVEQLLGREGFDFLRCLGSSETKKRHVRPPDLFIFNEKNEFFFAEVKWGYKDKLSDDQKTLFPQIIKKFSTKIELVYVWPK